MIDVITLVVVVGALLILGVWKAREALRRKDIRVKYAVTLKSNEGEFAGLLVEESTRTLVFENCMTVPHGDVAAAPILGRVYVDRANIAYRQELPNDPV